MTNIEPLNVDGIDLVLSECQRALEADGLSRNAAARQIGVSSATLSLWLNGTYKGDNDKIQDKVKRWLKTRREADRLTLAAAGLQLHRDLGVTDEVSSVLAHAHAVGDIVLIHGASGRGKSWAAARYCETHSNACLMNATRAVKSVAGLLKRVGDAVGSYGDHRSAMETEDAIIAKLVDRRALLVVDEAHHLSAMLLDELRLIRDLSGCGLALIGDDAIRMTLGRCPQIVGRIASRLAMNAPSQGDVAELLAGVIRRRPSKREIEAAMVSARGPGGFHSLRRSLERAWMAAQVAGRDRVELNDLDAAVDEATDVLADQMQAAG